MRVGVRVGARVVVRVVIAMIVVVVGRGVVVVATVLLKNYVDAILVKQEIPTVITRVHCGM